MGVERVYAGDYGWVLTIDFGDTDVSGASSYTIYCRDEDGTVQTFAASINASDSTQITYTVEDGDFATAGYYLIQPYISNLAGWYGYGLTCRLQVYPTYD